MVLVSIPVLYNKVEVEQRFFSFKDGKISNGTNYNIVYTVFFYIKGSYR